MIKPIPAMLLAGTILSTTFAAACGLVFASSMPDARLTQRHAERQAATDYRTAYAKCQLEAAGTRRTCVIDAHAAEDRDRDPATRGLRAQRKGAAHTATAMNAAERNGVIVEPACDVVTRERQASCEIQIGRDRNNNEIG